MIISNTLFYVICGVIAVLILIPSIKKKFVSGSDSFHWSVVFLAVLIPLFLFTPNIYTVTDCDNYTKEVLLLPKDDYQMGKHSYIVNNSDKGLYLAYIVYGTASTNNDDIIIVPGASEECQEPIDYVLEEAPLSISIDRKSKIKGEVKSELSCFDMSELEGYEDYKSEGAQQPVTAGDDDSEVTL